MKVLILDDDTQIRQGLQYGIDWESLGIDEVQSCGDGLSGLRIAEEIKPDIILSDVRMPGMDGLSFLHQVKAVLPAAKVVLISGYDDFEYLQKAVKYNADAYELKPVKLLRLIELIRELQEKINAEKGSDAAGISSGKYSLRIARAIDYITTHLAEPLSTVSMGNLLTVTPNYFCALFKQETGASFKQFLNQTRLERAQYLLEYTDKLIYEIAEETGFANYIYFSSVFKKALGTSPNNYRSRRKSHSPAIIVENHINL